MREKRLCHGINFPQPFDFNQMAGMGNRESQQRNNSPRSVDLSQFQDRFGFQPQFEDTINRTRSGLNTLQRQMYGITNFRNQFSLSPDIPQWQNFMPRRSFGFGNRLQVPSYSFVQNSNSFVQFSKNQFMSYPMYQYALQNSYNITGAGLAPPKQIEEMMKRKPQADPEAVDRAKKLRIDIAMREMREQLGPKLTREIRAAIDALSDDLVKADAPTRQKIMNALEDQDFEALKEFPFGQKFIDLGAKIALSVPKKFDDKDAQKAAVNAMLAKLKQPFMKLTMAILG
jgi:hypothetical protein